MRLVFILLLLAILSIDANPARAQSESERLANCLVQSSTGAQRLDLARWIAYAIIAHPSVRDSVAIPQQALVDGNRSIAQVFTQLITQSCRNESRDAILAGGNSFGLAFEALGRIATVELLNNPDVNTRIEEFIEYLNDDDFDFLE